MATVRKPSSVAARMTRIAISERFATRSFNWRAGLAGVGAAPGERVAGEREGRAAVGIRERRFYPKAGAGCESGDWGNASRAGLLAAELQSRCQRAQRTL